jgi:hypothetical protein
VRSLIVFGTLLAITLGPALRSPVLARPPPPRSVPLVARSWHEALDAVAVVQGRLACAGYGHIPTKEEKGVVIVRNG